MNKSESRPKYNNIHRQQLFHWIGSHIDERFSKNGGKLNNSAREEYVECLKGALKNGLWVKKPRDPDYLGNGDLIKVTRPITCFTEWTLGQSLPHTTRYGRLGLGFPKKFVLSRGGQPLIYVRDSSKNDPYTEALKSLAAYFNTGATCGPLKLTRLEELREHFDYLSHFNKRIRRHSQPSLTFRKRGRAATSAKLSILPDPRAIVCKFLLRFLPIEGKISSSY
jgi:Putative abortive phage resistance protein AbiGi, antitoxin